MKSLLLHQCVDGFATRMKIAGDWLPRLRASGLDSFDSLMSDRSGELVGWHKGRSENYRTRLADGQVIYIKRSLATERAEILRDLVRLTAPRSMVQKEAAGIRLVQRIGSAAPTIIARGQQYRLRLPTRGFLVTLPLPGVSLHELAEAKSLRLAPALRELAAAIGRIADAGYCWPDLLPRHVFVQEDGRIGLLDLERVHRVRFGGASRIRRSVRKFVAEMAALGAGPEHVRPFVESLRALGLE